MFSNNWNFNDIIFYTSDVEGLLKWFAHELVLFHCSRGDKEKKDFSITC